MQSRWNIRNALLVSFGLHFLTPLLLARCDSVAGWMEPDDLEVPEKGNPIVFELIEPTPGPEPEEVPETNLVSTKRSLAHSNEPAPTTSENERPQSMGESPLKENRSGAVALEEIERPREEGAESEALPDADEGGSPSLLNPSSIRREVSRSVEESRLRNPRGDSALPGELSFNTVDFEYAPYLMILKKRIEEMWYPPIASYGRGFKGESVVRFAVSKGGELELVELVSGADHESLDTAALNAIRYAGPLPPLPDDFPEDRWVITCTFYYR